MLTLINLIIVLLLLGCVAMWATYGFFSAFIQLIVVVVAGTLAFALWEPVSYMLLGRMPAYAHGVGLLGPFVILIIVLRTALDKLCKANVHVPALADQIGGGACGIGIGILAFGVLLNGVNFLPMAKDALGGEITLKGDKGHGYIRVDWYTPDALPTWGDGRLTILGTEGYIELRKYVDVGSEGANHLILVNGARCEKIDASGAGLPYFGRLLDDFRTRGDSAMTQAHVFKVCELALAAQAMAEAK